MNAECKVKIFACPISPSEVYGIARVKSSIRAGSINVEGICGDFILTGHMPFDAFEPKNLYFYGDKNAYNQNHLQAKTKDPKAAKAFEENVVFSQGGRNFSRVPLLDMRIQNSQLGLVSRTFDYVKELLARNPLGERTYSKDGIRSSLREALLDFPVEVNDWAKDAGRLLIYSGSMPQPHLLENTPLLIKV